MGNLVEHAKFELELAGLLDPKKDFYGGLTGKAVSGEEWPDDPFDGETYQNKRLGSLFKIGLYGKA